MSRTLAVGLLALALVSCSDPEVSQIIVRIEAEPGVVAMTRSLEVEIDGGPNRSTFTDADTVTFGGNTFPRTVALAPKGDDPSRFYRVVARARREAIDDPLASTFAQAALIGTYVRGETRVVVLRIEDSCIDAGCDELQHCADAFCQMPPEVTPEPLDGGVPDMGMPDGGGPDMGRCSSDAECDDGIECTLDACTTGSCTHEANDAACPAPANECLRAVCVLGTGCTEESRTGPCDNGDFCDGTDSCVDGSCTGSGDPCPGASTCDEDLDACTGCVGDGDCPNGQECSGGTCTCPTGDTELCDTAGDEDCNGLADCLDSACNGASCGANGRVCIEGDCGCLGTVELCSAAGDEDCNGAANCADSACEGRTCQSGRICISGSCDPDCVYEGPEASEGFCEDGRDNDCDGMTDCGDPECGGTCTCFGCPDGGGDACVYEGEEDTEGFCGDGRDNDCDGSVDCDDSGCDLTCECFGCADGGGDACVFEGPEDTGGTCTDGRDNDCDGFVDCDEFECDCFCGGFCDGGVSVPDGF